MAMGNEEVRPPKPKLPCQCGSIEWWWRPAKLILGVWGPGGWLCRRCYPPIEEKGEEK